MALAKTLKYTWLNGWPLFFLVAIPASLVMVAGMLQTGDWDGPSVSSMIQLSVRFAVPWLFLAFAASSLQILVPGPVSLWVARNRKYFGLCFAAGMAWQAFFILWLVTVYSDYYVNEVYVLRDAIEGVVGYMFLAVMTVTSFMAVRKKMSPQAWKLLHKSGIYFLWAYAISTYWWALFSYEEPVLLDYLYYSAGFAAAGLRIAAWMKTQSKRNRNRDPHGAIRPALKFLGIAVIGAAVVFAALARSWYPVAEEVLYGHALTLWPELYLPYWPFEPFFALFLAAAGAYLIVKARAWGNWDSSGFDPVSPDPAR